MSYVALHDDGPGAKAQKPVRTLRHPDEKDVPLIVDLDGCLIRSDLLFETALAYLSINPLKLFHLISWLFRGRAHLKRRLAETAGQIPPIPVNEKVAAYARRAKRSGRKVFLATGSDELLALKIGTRFEFLDGVIASDGTNNLKGRRKSSELQKHFPGGFDYIGDCNDDLHVWQHADRAIVVEPHSGFGEPSMRFASPPKH